MVSGPLDDGNLRTSLQSFDKLTRKAPRQLPEEQMSTLIYSRARMPAIARFENVIQISKDLGSIQLKELHVSKQRTSAEEKENR